MKTVFFVAFAIFCAGWEVGFKLERERTDGNIRATLTRLAAARADFYTQPDSAYNEIKEALEILREIEPD